MTADEERAVTAARAMVAGRGGEGRHQVAAAILTDAGLYTGLNLESRMVQAMIRAEAVAQAALAEPGAIVRFSGATDMSGAVLPPCGLCRELLADFDPLARVAVPAGEGVGVVLLSELLPHTCRGGERGLP